MMPYSFRPAAAPDASKVAELVDAAYGHYVERIGVLPGPMTDDYAEVIGTRQVTVAEREGAIVGVIENLALYAKLGYVEYERRSQGAFSLVYLRKQLG
jgi:hypothetical protein